MGRDGELTLPPSAAASVSKGRVRVSWGVADERFERCLRLARALRR